MRLAPAIATGAVAAVLALTAPPAGAAAAQPRIVYAGDWTGSMQLFAADPSGRGPLAQLTFARPDGLCVSATACGFVRPLTSPDGRRLAYWSEGRTPFTTPMTLWVARANGTGAHKIGPAFDASWRPGSRQLAYSAPDGIHVVTFGPVGRIVERGIFGNHTISALRYSPDGRTLAFVDSSGVALLRGGRERMLVAAPVWTLAWSPNGRRIAFSTGKGIFFVSAGGGRARLVSQRRQEDQSVRPPELAFTPSGRLLAFTLGGPIRLADTRTFRVRTLAATGHDLAWSTDGRRLLYVEGSVSPAGDEIRTGDVRTVTPAGRIRTVVSASAAYGGQIVDAAWARPARGVRYRRPQRVDGVFGGGPVQDLAADGARLAFIACGGVSAWTIGTDAPVSVEPAPDCRASWNRDHDYSLGLAGDRVAWWEKGAGLCFFWDAYEATIGSPKVELDNGMGCLGFPPTPGSGTAVGAGSLLVFSSWTFHFGTDGPVVDSQSVDRAEPGGCPCPALFTSDGPATPLDADAGRIVVSGVDGTKILAADGTVLLSLPVQTLAAQLSGSELVLAVGEELRVYDAGTGALRVSWPLPAQPAGHDCDIYGDPTCTSPAPLTLGDVSHDLAAYASGGEVHLLRLADGADQVVGPGALPRFADPGLAFADGARIRLIPFEQLPLQ